MPSIIRYVLVPRCVERAKELEREREDANGRLSKAEQEAAELAGQLKYAKALEVRRSNGQNYIFLVQNLDFLCVAV